MDKQKLYELTNKHKELKRLLEKIESVGIYPNQELTGMPRGCVISDKTSTTACDLVEYKEQLNTLLTEIQKLRKAIIFEISGVDGVVYDILFLKFVSGMDWDQIGAEVGKSREAVRRMYYRV